MTLFFFFLSLALHLITSFAAGADWCYEIQQNDASPCKGPSQWSEISAFCALNKQSPINVKTCEAEYDSRLKPFIFEGYDKENDLLLKNSGHSAELEIDGHGTIEISGGGLSGTYTALQLHFHWGSNKNLGSEHSLNGDRFPIELHVVHKKKTSERSEPSGGSTTSGGLAVLGFFFKEGASNSYYTKLIERFNSIATNGQNVTVSKVKLQDLIPKEEKLKLFYRYEGSLTTPYCNETVTWTVFPEIIELSKEQINIFYTTLNYKGGQTMTENFRPIQPLNGRKIYTSGVDAILPHTRYFLISLLVFYLTSVS